MKMIRRMTAVALVMLMTRMGLLAARDGSAMPIRFESAADALERMIDEAFRSSFERDGRKVEMDAMSVASRHADNRRSIRSWAIEAASRVVSYGAACAARLIVGAVASASTALLKDRHPNWTAPIRIA